MGKKENAVAKPVVEFARGRGIEVIKLSVARGGMGSSGWPDWLFLVRGGRPLLMEFKQLNKPPTKLQEERLKYLFDQGYDAYVVDNKEYGINLLMVRL
jgi:hypothetical protein